MPDSTESYALMRRFKPYNTNYNHSKLITTLLPLRLTTAARSASDSNAYILSDAYHADHAVVGAIQVVFLVSWLAIIVSVACRITYLMQTRAPKLALFLCRLAE